MSGREWKPGDVVTATVNGRPGVRVIAGWSKYDPQLRWAELSTRWADGDDDGCWFMPSQVTDHRPLVVIDPEDREQVARLADAFCSARWSHQPGSEECDPLTRSSMKEALNAYLASTPKPPEPTGLGAVVEAAGGAIFVRVAEPFDGWAKGRDWQRIGGELNSIRNFGWSDLAAVRVLSVGVTR